MLTPKQLQALPKPLTDIYEELSEFVMRDIARRIAGAAKITDTAEYQLYRARALGMSTKEITEKIAKINGVSEDKIRELILDAAERSNEFDARMLTGNDGAAIPLKDNEQLQKLMAAQIKQTNGTCQNLTGTLGFAERNANGQVVYSSLTDFLRHQMDMAQMKVATGVTDYNSAIRQACNALAESGLRTVYYASGRSDRIEVAVRRALMTSVSQITQKISEQNAAEFGADGWEISAHMGARPSHAVYQGRQYPNSQYETIVLPLINDYNCRHSAYPIIMGVTKPSYTEEQLAALDPPPFTYEGKQYTAYKAQQQMRKMERYMRKQKDRCIVADAAGDTEAFTTASIKLRRQKDIYEDFCKAAGTYTAYERTFVAGYNRRLAGKTGAVTRTQNKQKNLQIPLTELEKGGIIKREYDSDLAQKYGKEYYNNLIDLVEKCDNSDIKAFWQKHQSDIKIGNPKHSGRGYCSGVGQSAKIYVDTSVDQKGTSIHAPFQTLFHESGHAIDTLNRGNNVNGQWYGISQNYKNGLFSKTIKQEVSDLVDAEAKRLKTEFKLNGNNPDWLYANGFIEDWEYDFFKDRGVWVGGQPKYSKSVAYANTQKQIINNHSLLSRSDLSDMLEGATGSKIRCGAGHGKSYWKTDDRLATEAFAEMFSATIANPESLAVIKQYLPKSYDTFLEIIRFINQG